jgi:hypothetical protein
VTSGAWNAVKEMAVIVCEPLFRGCDLHRKLARLFGKRERNKEDSKQQVIREVWLLIETTMWRRSTAF